MSLIAKLKPYRKAAIGTAGLVLTVVSAWVDPNGTVGHIVTAVIAIASGYGIYRVPNSRVIPAAVAAIKAATAEKPSDPPADASVAK